jgi:adenylate kinase
MTDQTMYVILLGPPGAGKGTQAVQTAERTGLLHLSTGDMFRENLRNGTELGNLAKTFMDKGELVPDDVTIRMLLERISRDDARAGCLFDGFPRTVEQARALDEALSEQGNEIAVTVLIDVSNEEITRRLGGRVSCASCGSVFHEIFNPPNAESPCCDQVDMIQRDDDKPEAIANRLQVYADQTEPLVAYYRQAGKLSSVNGEQSPQAVGEDLLAALQAVSD